MVSAEPGREFRYVQLAGGGRQHEGLGLVDRVGLPVERTRFPSCGRLGEAVQSSSDRPALMDVSPGRRASFALTVLL